MVLAVRPDSKIKYCLPNYDVKCSICWANDQTSYGWVSPPVETEAQDDIPNPGPFVHQSNHFPDRILYLSSITLVVIVDVLKVMA